MEKDKEKIDEDINKNKDSQDLADSKEENEDEINLKNKDDNAEPESEDLMRVTVIIVLKEDQNSIKKTKTNGEINLMKKTI